MRREHSENKIIAYFENEVGSGMLQSSVQQTYNLQIVQRIRTETTNYQLHMVYAFGVLMFVDGMLYYSTEFQCGGKLSSTRIN